VEAMKIKSNMSKERLLPPADWVLPLVILIITLLAYSPALNGRPVWDDNEHLTRPELQSWNGLKEIWTNVGLTHQYYPLVHTVFWIEHRIWGDTTLYYHLINVLLHTTAALLLVKVLVDLKIPGAGFAGALFALHPVQVESVAWMSELKNTLSGVCVLSSALLFLKFHHTRNWLTYFVALGLFLLGLASKSVIAVLPAAILVVLWWKRGQLRLKEDVLPLVPFFAIGGSAGLFTAWVEQHFVGAEGMAFRFSIADRVLVAGRAFWFYLFKLFWPTKLTFVYPRWDVSAQVWWQYLFPIGALLFFAALIFFRMNWRGLLAGFLLFVILLFPALGFLNVYPFVYSFVADHFQYLACIGIITTTAAGLSLAADWVKLRPPSRAMVFSSLVAALATLTWQQAHIYRDEETLWRATIAENPTCSLAHTNLGALLVETGRANEAIAHYQQAIAGRVAKPELGYYNLARALVKIGKLDDAIAEYRRALQLNSRSAEAHYQLGRALQTKGEIDGAVYEYREALKLRPDEPGVDNELGNALVAEGLFREAIDHYESALHSKENDANIHYNLAKALAKSGDFENAISHYQRALTIQPDLIDARYELGSALLQQGRIDDAIARYEEVLTVSPDHVNARTNLGNLLLQKGRPADAIAQYEKSLELAPDDTVAQIDLAWVLATCSNSALRDGKKALVLAGRANEGSGGNNPLALRSLAAAYAETGQFRVAIETAGMAWQIALDDKNDTLMRALSRELKFYEANLPYRQ
jgi:tetratricopeptide (TPR) repeat protein